MCIAICGGARASYEITPKTMENLKKMEIFTGVLAAITMAGFIAYCVAVSAMQPQLSSFNIQMICVFGIIAMGTTTCFLGAFKAKKQALKILERERKESNLDVANKV